MVKKVILSAKGEHNVIKRLIEDLKCSNDIDLKLHNPNKGLLDLDLLDELFENTDLLVVKVGGDSSLDLLHYAKIHSIPTIQNVDTVLQCTNKVALDQALRNIFNKNKTILKNFKLAKAWTYRLNNVEQFKEWAKDKLPIVLKSHYQHEEYNRFNFLMRKTHEVHKFLDLYGKYLFTDLYIQQFIECDGIDRKVYVIGNNVYGVKRENPIYIYLRENPKSIDVSKIQTKPKKYYLIDLNDFPGFKGIKDAHKKIFNYIIDCINDN
ncbi:MAG: hypothetical protein P8Y70_19240 [Candidatus Lokiarchaeota archaeon]